MKTQLELPELIKPQPPVTVERRGHTKQVSTIPSELLEKCQRQGWKVKPRRE